jgi:hypothetical protein
MFDDYLFWNLWGQIKFVQSRHHQNGLPFGNWAAFTTSLTTFIQQDSKQARRSAAIVFTTSPKASC